MHTVCDATIIRGVPPFFQAIWPNNMFIRHRVQATLKCPTAVRSELPSGIKFTALYLVEDLTIKDNRMFMRQTNNHSLHSHQSLGEYDEPRGSSLHVFAVLLPPDYPVRQAPGRFADVIVEAGDHACPSKPKASGVAQCIHGQPDLTDF